MTLIQKVIRSISDAWEEDHGVFVDNTAVYAGIITIINRNFTAENTPNKRSQKIKTHFSPRNGGDNPRGQGETRKLAFPLSP